MNEFEVKTMQRMNLYMLTIFIEVTVNSTSLTDFCL